MLLQVASRVAFSRNLRAACLCILGFFMIPSNAWAGGGGPLLVIFNVSAYFVGIVWLIGIEYFMYTKILKIRYPDAWWDILYVNIISTVVVGIGFPLVMALVGIALQVLPENCGQMALVVTGWATDTMDTRFSAYVLPFSVFWIAVTAVLTILFEARLLRKRWAIHQFACEHSPGSVAFKLNVVSHIGLLLILISIWHELFFT